jgi:phosphatidylserine/phosphatidylglycerophosphate/cardiolipin synthase-like enzyme
MSEPRAYFSGIKEVVSEHLQKAQKSIIVAVAWFTEDELFFQLLRCAQQGLDVQLIIMDDPINQGSGLDYQLLVHHGAKSLVFIPMAPRPCTINSA